MEKRNNRDTILIACLSVLFLILVIRLAIIQLFDSSFKISAQNNALYYQTRYPARGLILDRHGNILVGNKNTYDIMVTPHYIKDFDTAALCRIFSLEIESVRETFKSYKKERKRIGYQSIPFLKQVPQEKYSKFIESSYKFPNFKGIPRTTRIYPYNAGGNLLGYVSEVTPRFLEHNPDYQQGDYRGTTGLEESCEYMLKGEKGYKIFFRDSKNKIQTPYKEGKLDKPAIPGKNVISTIDAELQNYGESLMKNKVGSIIAIEPATGEILSMISSPGLDVSVLGEINRHYNEISKDPFKPMFNRAVMSPQPPGSVFKLVNGLIGLQEGLVSTDTKYACHQGYFYRNLKVGCHAHKSPVNFIESIMVSCNTFYCHLFRNIIDNPNFNSEAEAADEWNKYVRSFGFGRKLGSDFPSEQAGFVPDSETYNKIYGKGGWKGITVISLAIGQGELGCTPLHLANLAAAIANRGYYYIPHIVRDHADEAIDKIYSERQYTLIDTLHFETIIEGMYRAVNSPPGQGATATIAAVKGLDICGKTGTAENPHGDEHAVFISFAPRENPKIAIAVYIENAGFGATWAAPIASLMTEKYLNGDISPQRKYLEERMKNANLLNKVPASPDYVPPKKKKRK